MPAHQSSPGSPPSPPSFVWGYLLAVLLVAAGVLMRLALTPVFGDYGRFLPLFIAVLLAAWFWGLGPGLLASLLAVLAGLYFFIDPAWSLRAGGGWWHLVAFSVESLVICGFALVARRLVIERSAERDRALTALAASEERFRTAFENAPIGMGLTDLNGRLLYVNAAFGRITGYSPDELAGQEIRLQTLMHPDDLPADRAVLARLAGGEIPAAFHERRYLRKDGTEVWVRVSISALRDEKGRPFRFVGLVEDISDRKAAEEAVRASEERYRLASQAANDAIYDWDIRTGWLTWSRAMADVFGWRTALDGTEIRWWNDLIHPDDAPRVGEQLRALLEGRDRQHWREEYRFRRADGSYADVLDRGFVVRGKRGEAVRMVGAMLDITERKQSEEAVRRSEEQIRHMASAMPQLVWTAKPDGTVDYFNDRICEFLGAYRENGVWVWQPAVHPDDTENTVSAWEHALRTGEVYQVEHRIRRTNGEYRWHLSRGVPARDEQGRIVRWYGTATDIHDLKTAQAELAHYRHHLEELVRERTIELERSSQRLRIAERMAALGTFSAGIGHDMGNLLLPIRARLDLLERRGLPAPFADDVGAIRQATDYLQSLSAGLRMLSRDPEAAAEQTTDLHAWWKNAQGMLRNALPRRFSLTCDLPEGLPQVRIGPPALMQAVFNIVQNAGDAMQGLSEGAVHIGAQAEPGGGWVRLTVRDTGPGMTEEVRRRCMEPFYTTKTRSISTGLGLSLVHGLIQKAGGSVQIESEPGRGAVFTLRLPAAPAGEEALAQRPAALVSLRDARLHSYCATLLTAMGFEVKAAQGASDEALRLWVVDAQGSDAAARRAFVGDRQDRRVVVMGDGVGGEDPRIVALPMPFQPAALRDVARQVLWAPPKAAGEVPAAAG